MNETKIRVLNQNVLIERDREKSDLVVRKSGIVTPKGQVDTEGLTIGTVLVAPTDQNLLIDNNRAVNDVRIEPGQKVWYSKYSAGLIFDDREDHEGEFLDMVPLEDLRAVVG